MGQSLSLTLTNTDIFPCASPISPKDRAKAAVLGAFVADAATMPLHWIYDQQVVEGKVKAAAALKLPPEFFSPTCCPFYEYTTGQQSPYGDEVIPILLSIVEKGHVDAEDLRETSFQFCKTYTGRLNRVTQRFLEQRKLGNEWSQCVVDDDLQFLAMMKVPIIVARYAGNPAMLEKLDIAVSIHQTNEKILLAARFVAKLLEKIVLGYSSAETLRWAKSSAAFCAEEKEYLSDPNIADTNIPFSVAAEMHGLNGQIPGCLKVSLYAVRIFGGYEVALRANIVAAGDNVARSWLIGAFLAAEQGMQAIPQDWRGKTVMYSHLENMVDSLVGSNSKLEAQVERACTLPSLFG